MLHTQRRCLAASVIVGAVLGLSTQAHAQSAERDLIRVYIFASATSIRHRPVAVHLPDAGDGRVGRGSYTPTHLRAYYYDADLGQAGVEALSSELQQTTTRQQLIRLVGSRPEADVFLEVVATDRGTALRQRPLIVVRLSVQNHVYTEDFLGEQEDLTRPPAFEAAQKIELWIADNHETLQRVRGGQR